MDSETRLMRRLTHGIPKWEQNYVAKIQHIETLIASSTTPAQVKLQTNRLNKFKQQLLVRRLGKKVQQEAQAAYNAVIAEAAKQQLLM